MAKGNACAYMLSLRWAPLTEATNFTTPVSIEEPDPLLLLLPFTIKSLDTV